MKIPFRGNTARFAGQSSAKLLSVHDAIAKALPEAQKQHYGGDLPRGHCIVTVYLGNLGVPFVDVQKWSIMAMDKLRGFIGQSFDIEVPAIENEPVDKPETVQESLPV